MWRDKESWTRISFLKVYWCCLPNIIRISTCLSKLQLAKVGTFFWDSVCLCLLPFLRYRSSKNGVTLKPGVTKGGSRSLKMVPFHRSYTTFYWSAVVSIDLCCTISRNRKLIRVTSSNKGFQHKCVHLSDYNRCLNQIWYKTHDTLSTRWNDQIRIT